jgi:peptidoglycan/xylan/chitin deacetylase (PgdA/CDA1 family)
VLLHLRRRAPAGAVAGLALSLLAVPAPAPVALVTTPAANAAPKSCPSVSSSVTRFAPGAGRTVALTFDDGPGPETPKVLEILRKHNARATFYQLGSPSVIWPEYSQQVVTEGHQLANHSWDHPNFARLSAASQKVQLDRTTSRLAKVTGVRPCSFRPPGGRLGSSTGSIAAGRRLKTGALDDRHQ